MSSLCKRFFLYAVMRFLIESGTEYDVFLEGRRMGDNCSRAQKWYRRNQNLEVETEPQLIKLGSQNASNNVL